MARDDPYFRLRIPETLKAKIEASAVASNRSITAEIISRLEQSFDQVDQLAEASANIDDLYIRLEKLEAKVRQHDVDIYDRGDD